MSSRAFSATAERISVNTAMNEGDWVVVYSSRCVVETIKTRKKETRLLQLPWNNDIKWPLKHNSSLIKSGQVCAFTV